MFDSKMRIAELKAIAGIAVRIRIPLNSKVIGQPRG
jgi:hypothetical protein